MTINSSASSILVIWYIMGSILNVGIIISLAFMLFKLSTRLESLEAKLIPILNQASETLRALNKLVILSEPGVTTVLNNIGDVTTAAVVTTEAIAKTTSRIASAPGIELSSIKQALSAIRDPGK